MISLYNLFLAPVRRVRDRRALEYVLLTTVLVYLFLNSSASRFIWGRCEIWQGNQFPWRMLLPLVFFGVLLVAIELNQLCKGMKERSRKNILIFISVIAFFQGVIFLLPRLEDISGMTEKEEEAFIAKKVDMYALKEESWGVDEFLPRLTSLPLIEEDRISGSISINRQEVRGPETIWSIGKVPRPGWYRLGKYWNVRYRIRIDGRSAPVHADGKGEMVIFLNEDDSEIRLILEKPLYVLWSERLSLLISILLVFGLLYTFLPNKWKTLLKIEG